ncbi:hypothetical protein QTN25_003875 [Entamoeba marina]
MEDSIHEALVVSNILTVSSDKSNFNLYNQFKYFVPSTQKFHAFPSQGEFYLVEWKNYSIREATWVEKKRIN